MLASEYSSFDRFPRKLQSSLPYGSVKATPFHCSGASRIPRDRKRLIDPPVLNVPVEPNPRVLSTVSQASDSYI
ncbi:hypothetical protein SAMN04489751_1990 [Brevibacterium sandarakinum]|uniref:Uncharacterized protein n=1 Tax=Brevibacterium sandarakinum TaxID=629680 RepID=A0A1H1S4J4_BRESA|nr:hypothetical protein SAMN04489751_1990 [Brevibacterium sandarakinum]